MRSAPSAHHGSLVPIGARFRGPSGDKCPGLRMESDARGQTRSPTHPVPARQRRGSAGVGRCLRGSSGDQGGHLAHPSRIRVGEPPVGSLDRLLLQPLSPGAVRRAWVRDERLERGRSLSRALAERPRIGDRRRRTEGALHPARHLPGSGVVSGLCRPAPRAGLAPRAVWRLCARVLRDAEIPIGHARTRPSSISRGLAGERTIRRSGRSSPHASSPARLPSR